MLEPGFRHELHHLRSGLVVQHLGNLVAGSTINGMSYPESLQAHIRHCKQITVDPVSEVAGTWNASRSMSFHRWQFLANFKFVLFHGLDKSRLSASQNQSSSKT
jgi:hypothetical protein